MSSKVVLIPQGYYKPRVGDLTMLVRDFRAPHPEILMWGVDKLHFWHVSKLH